MAKTVRFYTLGCKVNQYDSEAMLEIFLAGGYRPAPPNAPADVFVVNTCTVTGTGDQKSLKAARRYLRQNPGGELIVAGCLAQRMGEQLRDTGARLILGTQYRARVVELLEAAVAAGTQTVAVESLQSAPFEPLTIRAHEGHTRAVMKIQEGCDNRCAYCIIPSVRGAVRSKPVEDVLTEARALADAGFSELVLTGVHLTSYGRDLPGGPKLTDAIRAVHAVPGVRRIRLGSLEPAAVNAAFVDAVANLPKLCPQFHLSLQSGSDAVLARMRRQYQTDGFLAAVERIRRAYPDAALTTDVIVGFPGETDEEYEQTEAFCRQVGFMKLHVFPYSRRAGTPAADMPDQVPQPVRDARAQQLIAVGGELSAAYRRGLLGSVQPVLLEQRMPDGSMVGYTPQYVSVTCPGGTQGEILSLRLTALTQEGTMGERVEFNEEEHPMVTEEETAMDDCLFCQIIKGDIPSRKIYEDEDTFAFHDIHPQARAHALVVSKKHAADLSRNAELSDRELAACLRACAAVARELGLEEGGYRVVNNCGENACQTVRHLHFHVIGGEKLSERMA